MHTNSEKLINISKGENELSRILFSIANSIKEIYKILQNPSLEDEKLGRQNTTGDFQSKLDIHTEKIFINNLSSNKNVAAIISEESSKPILLNELEGEYIINLDPLDGSLNIKSNSVTGSIFSITKKLTRKGIGLSDEDFLQKGRNQILSGFSLYGLRLVLVLTDIFEKDVKEYIWDNKKDTFILKNPSISIPQKARILSINETYSLNFEEETKDFINKLKKENLKSRYSGCLVADIYRILITGGVYIYPKSKKSPNGKIRLLYESNPLSLILEHAGGSSTDGKNNLLHIKPNKIHQATPVYMGNKNLR